MPPLVGPGLRLGNGTGAAREIIARQLQFGGGYNRNAVPLLLAEVQREHGQGLVDTLIRELDLEQAFGLKSGAGFSGVGR